MAVASPGSILIMQEVVGTDDTALQAVIAADTELMALRAEEADIQARLGNVEAALGAVSLEEPGPSAAVENGAAERAPAGMHEEGTPPVASTSAAADADNDRLAEIYERLAVRWLPDLAASLLSS